MRSGSKRSKVGVSCNVKIKANGAVVDIEK